MQVIAIYIRLALFYDCENMTATEEIYPIFDRWCQGGELAGLNAKR